MIQRIQTVYLSIALILAIILFTGIAQYNSKSFIIDFNVINTTITENLITTSKNHYAILILNVIFIGVCLYTIMQFKNRKKQLLLCTVLFLLAVLQTLAHAYYNNEILNQFNIGLDYKNIKLIFPFISLIFIKLAQIAIKKDDDLVKSADRLR